MGTQIGDFKVSSMHRFQRATLLASGKDHFIFDRWDSRPTGWGPEFRSYLIDHKSYTERLQAEMNPRDPIDFFHLSINAGKSIPAARCMKIADAFELLRPALVAMDMAQFNGFHTDWVAWWTMEYHLDAHITHLRACAKARRVFQYRI